MKIKSLMLAASIVMTGAASVGAASFPTAATQIVSMDESNLETIYSSWLSSWTTVFNQVAGENNWTTTILDRPREKFLDIPDVTLLWSYSTGQTGSEFVASFIYTGGYASYTAVPTAVPGPEAGAGLGAVALGSMAAWAKRRRTNKADSMSVSA